VPEGTTVSYQAVKIAGRIIQLRLQAFGVDSIVRIKDERHLTIELPDAVNTSQLVTATGSGFLEFVNAGDTPLQKGQVVHTTGLSMAAPKGQSLPSAASTTSPVYQTVMTGQDVRSAGVAFQQVTNQPYIQFTLTDNGSKIFADFTEKNVGKCLAIVLDKKVISSPVIKSPITDGSGIIEGRFTADEANGLVVQLKYGALPVPVKIIETTAIPR
jgi:preprotein translocase subunit SecD